MVSFKTWCRFRRPGYGLVGVILTFAIVTTGVRMLVPPPASVGLAGEPRQSVDFRFFRDDSWIDAQGRRQLSHTIFDAVFESIRQAQSLILVDMFLFNAWQGPVPELHRSLADELVQSLMARKADAPNIRIVLISDPINTVYGGLESRHFDRLRAAGIDVIVTRLQALQDSNPAWSAVWRLFIAPWGNSTGKLLPNPFGEGRVSLRSYLTMLNFKANHRKLLVSDDGKGRLTAMVSSANPHDGSSAHRNVAARFGGLAAHDLLASELALLNVNGNAEVTAAIAQTLEELHLSVPSLNQSTDSGESINASSGNTTL